MSHLSRADLSVEYFGCNEGPAGDSEICVCWNYFFSATVNMSLRFHFISV